ncbi:MAG: hypothetical protein PHF29_02520 [Candidatus Riflebacteria bacterium]|nr:hypothetical protein [Candidatus Riflebacteria bacterium]
MYNQASTLQNLVETVGTSQESPEEFLGSVPRTNKYSATALVFPQEFRGCFPEITSWITEIMGNNKSCLWDQAGLVNEALLPKTHTTLRYQTPKVIKTDTETITVLPKQNDFAAIIKGPQQERIRFLRQLNHNLKNYSEVWISIEDTELKTAFALMNAVNKICLMVPDHPDAAIKCYELVKVLRNNGHFSQIELLEFTSENGYTSIKHSNKIKKVAKDFLGLDLIGLGVVLSSNAEGNGKSIIHFSSEAQKTKMQCIDFLFVLNENVVYQIPGTI